MEDAIACTVIFLFAVVVESGVPLFVKVLESLHTVERALKMHVLVEVLYLTCVL